MTPYRAVLLALVVVGGALTAAVPTAAAGVGVDASDDTEVTLEDVPLGNALLEDTGPTAAANDTTNNSTLGADISSFMQSSTAEVDGAVETGMWTAAFNSTENQSVQTKLVERRTSELRTRLSDLQQRKQELTAEREAGNISEVAYKAKVSRLLGQINALRSAIDATSTGAKQANASGESLDALRKESQNLTGPEISSVARNMTGVSIDRGGPPADVGNSTNAGGGTDAAGASDKKSGPPAGVGNDSSSNATDTGNASDIGGPPNESTGLDNPGNAPIVGNSSENGTTIPNGSVPGMPPRNESDTELILT